MHLFTDAVLPDKKEFGKTDRSYARDKMPNLGRTINFEAKQQGPK